MGLGTLQPSSLPVHRNPEYKVPRSKSDWATHLLSPGHMSWTSLDSETIQSVLALVDGEGRGEMAGVREQGASPSLHIQTRSPWTVPGVTRGSMSEIMEQSPSLPKEFRALLVS